jgi:hypothetical protein
MNIGMLWFDDSNTTLQQKIIKAADYYEKKYGKRPNLCLVHPSMLVGNVHVSFMKDLSVRPYRPVLPGHIWIGIEEMPVAEVESEQ